MAWWVWVIVVVVALILVRQMGRWMWRRNAYAHMKRQWLAAHRYVRDSDREEIDKIIQPGYKPVLNWKHELESAVNDVESRTKHCPYPMQLPGHPPMYVEAMKPLLPMWDQGVREAKLKVELVDSLVLEDRHRFMKMVNEWRTWKERVKY